MAEKMSFEKSMARLEEIAAELEGEKLPLDKSVKLYEEGVKLAAKCATELEDAKRAIACLSRGRLDVARMPSGVLLP